MKRSVELRIRRITSVQLRMIRIRSVQLRMTRIILKQFSVGMYNEIIWL